MRRNALGSSPIPSSKKRKVVSGYFSDQSIEGLNDVVTVGGVNLEEEEDQLFCWFEKDRRASEASRKFVQEERLILQKAPLQKKLAEIGIKCGLKSISDDAERCLSLSVEERVRGLISTLIRLSKQRVDAEKPRHHTITSTTSEDVRRQVMHLNRNAREEFERKQAEEEKLRKLDEANKEEDEQTMRTRAAANVAARAAVGGDDPLSKWKLVADGQARQKHQGKDHVNRASTSTAGVPTKDNREPEKRGSKFDKVIVPETRVARRSVSVKDVIAALEREPQMSRSSLIYLACSNEFNLTDTALVKNLKA